MQNHNVSFQIPAELYAKLGKYAKAAERPKSYLLRKALEEYLLDMEEDDADLKEARHRLANPEGPPIPWEEVKRELGLEN
jgi:predicted DNA-binding protein